MKKRAMTLGLALFCAFLLCGCQRTTPAAPAQEAAPEPEAAEETVLLLEDPAPVEPEPEPEPEPFAAGEELLLFGIRTPTLTDGEALYVKAEDFAACAQLSCVVTEDGVMLRWDGREELFPISRRDQLQPGDAFLQDGAAYVEVCLAAERFGFVSGEAEDGTMYFARKLTLDPPAENVNVPVLMYHAVSDDLWGYSSHLINECQRKGFTPYTVCQCYDTPMTMQLVQAGFGISYLPRSIVETHPGSNIYSKPLVGLPAKSYPTLLWSSNIYYANCVKRFISMFGYPT